MTYDFGTGCTKTKYIHPTDRFENGYKKHRSLQQPENILFTKNGDDTKDHLSDSEWLRRVAPRRTRSASIGSTHSIAGQ